MASTQNSTVTDCWNSETSSTHHNNPTGSSSQLLMTKCLFSDDDVTLSLFNDNIELKNILTTICELLDIPKSELPPNPTQEMFPMCAKCTSKFLMLSKLQKVRQMATTKIIQIVKEVWMNVVVADYVSSDPSQPGSSTSAALEQMKCTEFRKSMMEAYTKKRLEQAYKEATAATGNDEESVRFLDECSSDLRGFGNESECRNISQQNQEGCPGSVLPHVGEAMEEQYSPVLATNVDYQAFATEDDDAELGDAEITNWSQSSGETYNLVADPLEVAQYHDENDMIASDALLITNENAETGEISLVESKENFAAVANDDDVDDEEGTNQSLYPVTSRKRRNFCEGLEVYFTKGTGAFSNMEFLNCSVCSFSKRFTTNSKTRKLKEMKTHIRETHKDVYTGPFKCNICGKPIKKGPNQHHLLSTHQFTHKNQKEREAWIAAKEKARLERSKNGRETVAGGHGFGGQKRFQCPICGRRFQRKCHLNNHLRAHRRSQPSSFYSQLAANQMECSQNAQISQLPVASRNGGGSEALLLEGFRTELGLIYPSVLNASVGDTENEGQAAAETRIILKQEGPK